MRFVTLESPACRLSARSLSALAAVALLCSQPAKAQAPVPAKLSLTEAVSMAHQVNTGIKSAQTNRLNAESSLRVARLTTSYEVGAYSGLERNRLYRSDGAAYNESLFSQTFTGSATYEGLMGTQASLSLTPFGTGNGRGNVSLTVTHPLIQGRGQFSDKYNAVQNALTDAKVQSLQYGGTEQSTVLGVIEYYFYAVQAREQVKVQEEAYENARVLAEGTRQKAEEGIVAGIEVGRADIEVSTTRESLNQQRQTARAAMDSLMMAIGTGIGQEPELTDSVPEVGIELPPLDEAVKRALANRTEMAVYKEQLTNQQRKLEVANDTLRTSLNAFASLASSDTEAGIISASLVDAGSMTVGLKLAIPLDKTSRIEERNSAARGLDLLKSQETTQGDTIAQEVRSAYRSVETQRNSVQIYIQNIKEAEDSLEQARLSLEEGITDNRDFLDAQESLTSAKTGLLSAKIQLYLASVNLKYAMGEDLAEVVESK